MISKILINFENCYGIKNLSHEFDFSNNNMPVAVYSPNGMMKTSFAMTFSDHSEGKQSQDRIHSELISRRVIKDQNGTQLPGDNIFVINSYDESYKSSNISKLLASKKLKDEYESIYQSIREKKDTLIKALKKTSGIKKNDVIEIELSKTFNLPPKKLLAALGRAEREVKRSNNPDYAKILYNNIFSDKVVSFLEKEDFKTTILDYSNIYEQLIDNSNYFKRGIFNHNNAATIAKNLKTNGWFDSGHSVKLNTLKNSTEVTGQKELEEIIQNEKNAILTDKNLSKSFDKIDKALSNNELKQFREYILENQFIIPELTNISALQEKIWIAYLNDNLQLYEDLMAEYDSGESRIAEIIKSAKNESTTWRKVLKTFNERFSVPFVVNMDNQDDVILGLESPQISFEFKNFDVDEKVRVEESKLKEILSNGEKRALYILNIIFEVIARKEEKKETVFIVDDIADSFDYKNKYAIIEYLKDIKENDIFHLVILTHNFDFYRTVRSRLGIYGQNKLHTIRSPNGISFTKDKYSENPFTTWKNNLSDQKMLVASIPFIRNIAEYTGYKDEYNSLTALLHIKPITHTLTLDILSNVYRSILHDSVEFNIENGHHIVTDSIYSLCDQICINSDEEPGLEGKIILSIGIRLLTEDYMIRKIDNKEYVDGIRKNQTLKLIKRFKSDFPMNLDAINFIERVNLMTPENIHINSFMYEPILDMSDYHLKALYLTAKQHYEEN
jgi:ABC-type lipoprotein export system ATPase subunit